MFATVSSFGIIEFCEKHIRPSNRENLIDGPLRSGIRKSITGGPLCNFLGFRMRYSAIKRFADLLNRHFDYIRVTHFPSPAEARNGDGLTIAVCVTKLEHPISNPPFIGPVALPE